ncbi:HAMP domain-containing sensor histidine kinase [Nocardioides sp. GXZ039]|uniref:HAMP domain-containing sensor histidine kinase n=1 Tax=Nocardioides sp. GXZ039 TaxID=3136018 RepID=UPI0030F42987
MTLALGALSLAVAGSMAIVSWTLVTHSQLDQRRQEVLAEAEDDAGLVGLVLARGAAPGQAMAALTGTPPPVALLWRDGAWYSAGLRPEDLPARLSDPTHSGRTQLSPEQIGGRDVLLVEVPIRPTGSLPHAHGGGRYYAVFGLDAVESLERRLALILLAAAVGTGAAGIVLGRWLSDRALRPLRGLTEAAEAFAQGDVEARLEAAGDPDLMGLARSFNETAEAFGRRVAADARFAGDVSHELRTPLTTMLNSLELMENRRDELPDRLREPLDLLAGDLARFRTLVVDLIEISRDDTASHCDHDERERIEIMRLCRHTAAATVGRDVRVDGPDELYLDGDKRRLARVVANLVANAETHGHGVRRIEVTGCGARLCVAVEDHGPGVAPAERDRIFQRFARSVDPAGSDSGGVGLGLAIVERHLSWHGGGVLIEDADGGGARFVAWVPWDRRLRP